MYYHYAVFQNEKSTAVMVHCIYLYSISEIPFRVRQNRSLFIWLKYYLSSFGVCLGILNGLPNSNIIIHKEGFIAVNQIYLVCR